MAKLTARYLVDKSALARMVHESVRRRLAPILQSGEAARCAIVDLEVLYSARNAKEHAAIRRRRRLAYDRIPLSDEVFDRAIEVQGALAKTGRHRVPILNLVIAAAAERTGLIVLHYDADFDTISSVTGQRSEWIVPRGSVD